MRFTTVALLVFVACAKTPETPSRPPDVKAQRLEGVRALAKCLASPQEKRVSVSARAVETKDGPALHFRLTNKSAQPLRLYRSSLPWGNGNAIEIGAVGTNGEIPVYWPIDDSAPQEPFVLAVGESLEGQFSLASRVPDIASARNRSDIVVTWCYRFMDAGEQAGGFVNGTVTVPKSAS
jgi:hypothetical protein